MNHEARLQALRAKMEEAVATADTASTLDDVVAMAAQVIGLAEQPVDAFALLVERLGMDRETADVALLCMVWQQRYSTPAKAVEGAAQ